MEKYHNECATLCRKGDLNNEKYSYLYVMLPITAYCMLDEEILGGREGGGG